MKKPWQVNIPLLQTVINDLEKDQNFTTQISMATSVAKEYNNRKAASERDITHSIVLLRGQSGEVSFTTTKSKRGGFKSPEHQKKFTEALREPRKKKIYGDAEYAAAMHKKFPGRPHLVEGIIAGKPMSCIAGFCIQCMGNDSTVIEDIRECPSPLCTHYHLRPYKLPGETNGESI